MLSSQRTSTLHLLENRKMHKMTVVSYDESTDKFSVEIQYAPIKQEIDAQEFAALYSASHNCKAIMSGQDIAIARLFAEYFNEEPNDLVGKSTNF